MEPHYRTALDEMTLAGEEDDLAEIFPLMAHGPAIAAIRRPDRTCAGSVPGAAGSRPVTRHHSRPGPAGLQIGRAAPAVASA